jgi:UDP-glucose 4-epimerase
MKILLTGGLGFIGSHIYVELCQKNHDVIILDNLANSKIEQAEKLKDLTKNNVKLYIGDMMNINSIEKVFIENKITHVIHLAGLKAVAESIQKPIEYYYHNLQILFNLLEIMKKYNCKNIIFSSSATVYGSDGKNDFFTENMPIGQNITNPYGQTKYFQEQILKDLFISNNTWNITILRYFNPVGCHSSGLIGEDPNGIPANLFPCILRSLKNKTQLKIYGNTYNTYDGTCIRDFIHVVDLAKAHVKVINCIGYNVYNVGTGKETSVLDIITTFEKINNIKLDWIIDEKRDGDIGKLCANCDKIYNDMGWEAEYNIEDMCRDTFNYFSKK